MKIYTMKFYGDRRHDEQHCENLFQEILDKHEITNIIKFKDSNEAVGYHINGFVYYHNYMKLLKLYKLKGPKKDKRFHWYMKDIPDEEVTHWMKYCILRENQYKNRFLID